VVDVCDGHLRLDSDNFAFCLIRSGSRIVSQIEQG
jgi:hypothetical protein